MPPTEPTFRSPFDEHLGVRLTEASPERVVALLPVTPKLHQPFCIVHGGVFTTLVETVASVGASLWAAAQAGVPPGADAPVTGISNHTDFLRAVSGGQLRAEGVPLQRGRTLQLWEVRITDERGRLVAHGKVKLLNLGAGKAAPGGA